MKVNSEFGDVMVEGVSKTFDGETVLAKIDLKVASSEILSLLGPSGCGKTTLLRSIAGLENPEEGKITICDQVVLDDSHQQECRDVPGDYSYSLFKYVGN
mgnify:CR=1 FL=1